MASDPEELLRSIERTREELAHTVDTIAGRLDPKRVAKRGVDAMRERGHDRRRRRSGQAPSWVGIRYGRRGLNRPLRRQQAGQSRTPRCRPSPQSSRRSLRWQSGCRRSRNRPRLAWRPWLPSRRSSQCADADTSRKHGSVSTLRRRRD